MWELDCEESWEKKNWCFWTVVLEKTLESPLDCKEIQTVHPKGDQSWVFIRRTDAEAETPILWPPHVKSWLTGKTLMLGGIGGRRRRDDRGWDGWMASLTQWTWVWVGSGSWWWTGRPGMLRFMGSQRVGHDWATELNWTEAIEGWMPKKRCFWIVALETLLRVPWTARISNQSILKEINPECSLEGLMLKLKFQYFGPLRWKAYSLEKTLMLGKIEGRRRRRWQRMRWRWQRRKASSTQWTWVWTNSGR